MLKQVLHLRLCAHGDPAVVGQQDKWGVETLQTGNGGSIGFVHYPNHDCRREIGRQVLLIRGETDLPDETKSDLRNRCRKDFNKLSQRPLDG